MLCFLLLFLSLFALQENEIRGRYWGREFEEESPSVRPRSRRAASGGPSPTKEVMRIIKAD